MDRQVQYCFFMRTFLTLVPDAATSLEILKWSELCWPGLHRRIPVQSYHVTIAFLGDTDDRQLQKLSEVFEDFSHSSVEINLSEVGYWPESEVLWLGCKTVTEPLESLHSKCMQAANRIGARGGAKRYQPHITLGRKIDVPPGAALIEPDFQFTATALELWSSARKSDGAKYETLAVWQLS